MFELFFGGFWLLITGVITFMFYGTGSTVTVNGVPMEHAEFVELLWPKIFLGVFWIIGLVMLFLGIRKIYRNIRTSTHGVETYGVIIDITPTNMRINNMPVMQAEVAVVQDGRIEMHAERIGTGRSKYHIGDYLRLKCYKNDINILEQVEHSQVPYLQLPLLEQEYQSFHGRSNHYTVPDYDNADEYITINGQRYRKID